MTDRTVIKNADTGQFASQEYATEHPESTYTQTIREPDHLADLLAQIDALDIDWTLFRYRDLSRMPPGTQPYEFEAWRSTGPVLRAGGATPLAAAQALVAAIEALPEPDVPEDEGAL